jgi:hypothetical protein
MAVPPFDAGAPIAKVAWPLPGVALVIVGALGTVALIVIAKFWLENPATLFACNMPLT